MKKLLFITLLIGILVACNGQMKKAGEHWDSPTMFIVKSIRKDNGLKNFVVYKVEVIDANDFSYDYNNTSNNLTFEFTDSLYKYKVGQAIHFTKF